LAGRRRNRPGVASANRVTQVEQMTILRRFLVVQMLMLWQGGFLFYAAVVVPIGADVLGSSFEQGGITRFVTQQLNFIGAGALVVFLWELVQAPAQSGRQRWILWSCWLVLAAGLATLFVLHPYMLERVDFGKSRFVGTREDFRVLHRTYLWISTVQWLAGLVFALVLVWSWRAADRASPSPT
jgi:hypothetical protein